MSSLVHVLYPACQCLLSVSLSNIISHYLIIRRANPSTVTLNYLYHVESIVFQFQCSRLRRQPLPVQWCVSVLGQWLHGSFKPDRLRVLFILRLSRGGNVAASAFGICLVEVCWQTIWFCAVWNITSLLHREMDVWMYVCVGSFKYLGTDTYARMTSKLVFPLYFLYQVGGVLAVVSGVLKVWR